jgi:hypothetical protein
VTRAERQIERDRGGSSRALAVVSLIERFRALQPRLKSARHQTESVRRHQSSDSKSRADVTGAIERYKFPASLRTKVGEFAEVLVATSGVLAVVVIVLAMTMMVRGIQSLRRP